MYVCIYVCIYVCVCKYVCMYVCLYVCMNVCVYVCVYVCVCMYVWPLYVGAAPCPHFEPPYPIIAALLFITIGQSFLSLITIFCELPPLKSEIGYFPIFMKTLCPNVDLQWQQD